jgi:hypothetical protein
MVRAQAAHAGADHALVARVQASACMWLRL